MKLSLGVAPEFTLLIVNSRPFITEESFNSDVIPKSPPTRILSLAVKSPIAAEFAKKMRSVFWFES